MPAIMRASCRAGGRNTAWGMTVNWMAADRRAAFGIATDGSGGVASTNASLYLLVKYLGVPPSLFICKGDRGTTEFKLSDLFLPASRTLADLWDFGPPAESFRHCSYAYHIPYSQYALTTFRDPNLAVAADRNPWIQSPAADPQDWSKWRPDVPYPGGIPGTSAQALMGNSVTHKHDGQNVLFLDGRVTFETRSYCGVERDNIYTLSTNTTGSHVYGAMPVSASVVPTNRNDSLLVHDPQSMPYSEPKRRRP